MICIIWSQFSSELKYIGMHFYIPVLLNIAKLSFWGKPLIAVGDPCLINKELKWIVVNSSKFQEHISAKLIQCMKDKLVYSVCVGVFLSSVYMYG